MNLSSKSSIAPAAPDLAAQVVIAGAGPVGLMLAIELRLAGLDVLVVEQRPTGTVGESRAPGINARTMEIFASRGLAETFREQGRALPFVVFAGVAMDPHEQDPDWPDGWILPQHETERILAARATELGARICWSTTVTGLVQDEHSVDVRVQGPDGVELLRAAYLVGCDGGHSAVRKASGIAFPGLAPETWWVVGDLDLADPPNGSQPFGSNDQVGRYQLSQTEPGWFRLSMMRLTRPQDPTAPVTLDEVRQTMVDGLGHDHGLRSARWMSQWSDGFRHAARYRADRVFLAGDAAHTHTPIGGQGLNVGIQDAVNLGWKLAAVLHGEAPADLLDTYHDERWPVAAGVLKQSMAQTELVKPGPRRAAIQGVFEDLLDLPAAAMHLCGELSGLGLTYPLGDAHPLLGRRMPNLTIATSAGQVDVFTLLQRARPLLITLTSAPSSVIDLSLPAAGDLADRLTGHYQPDQRGDLWHVPVFGDVSPFDAVLVRPDGYVAWICSASQEPDLSALTAAIAHQPPVAPSTGTTTAAGTWEISFTTPRGEQHAELVLQAGDGWTGTYNGEPVTRLALQDSTLTFTARIREPFPTKVVWTGTIDGDAITGKAKASFMTLPFTALRTW